MVYCCKPAMSSTEPGIDQAATIGRRIVRLITRVTMLVQTDAAHTQQVVTSCPSPPSSAACRINVIDPAKEMTTAMNPAVHAEKEESLQDCMNRCLKQRPHRRAGSVGGSARL